MVTDEYVQIVARAIATATETFLTTNENGTPLNERARIYNPGGDEQSVPNLISNKEVIGTVPRNTASNLTVSQP